MKRAGVTDWTLAEAKALLSVNDSIKTGANSRVSLTFFDGSIIELSPGTQIEIKELVTGKSTGIRLKQEIGKTLSKVEKLVDPASRYEIETPAAIAAVRGSQMRVTVDPDGTTTIQNVEGKISVTAQGKEIIIPEGSASTVKPGEPPGLPANSALYSFSIENGNPNGSWSYGWMPVDFNIFNLYTLNDSSAFGNASGDYSSWYAMLAGDRTPCVWMNNDDLAWGAPTGWLSLHPGPGKEPSVIRWTAPTAGSVRVTGEFLAGDPGSMTVAVRHNNREIWSATDSGSYELMVSVSVGDTIDFMVYGGYFYGNTPVRIDISYRD